MLHPALFSIGFLLGTKCDGPGGGGGGGDPALLTGDTGLGTEEGLGNDSLELDSVTELN